MSERLRVLAVEDDVDHFLLIRACLSSRADTGTDFTVARAGTLREALEMLSTDPWDAVLLDLGLPDASGLDVFRAVRRAARGAAIVVTTCMGDEGAALEAVRLGARDFVSKVGPGFAILKRVIRDAVRLKERDGRAVAGDAR